MASVGSMCSCCGVGGGGVVNKAEHIKRHKKLHGSLDELVADFIGHTKKYPSKTSIMEFMEWSAKQIVNPNTKE